MANEFTAQFAPSASMRLTDATVYAQIVADYGFGTPIIFGVSPVTLAATYGLSVVNNPTAAQYNTLPAVFTTTAESVVLGTAISTSANGVQTLSGQSYTDVNGVLFTSVTWEWQVEVVLYTAADTSTFTAQVVTWAGDGTAARAIPTTADLSTGETAILIFRKTGGAVAPTLATTALLAVGKHAAYSADPPSTTGGVMSMTATGFTVTDDAAHGVGVNTVGGNFVALVFHDTASVLLKTGSYVGTGVSGTFSTGLDGQTMVWVTSFSGAMLYAETDHMPAGGAIHWDVNGVYALTGVLGVTPTAGLCTKGTDAYINTLARTYWWVSFAFTTGMRAFFDTFKVTGAGGVGAHATGLGFTPVFALARPYLANAGALTEAWRGPTHTGTDSQGTLSSSDIPATGINSFASGDVGVGVGVISNGTDGYGFALAIAGTVPEVSDLTWIHEDVVTNADGTTSTIQTIATGTTAPDSTYSLYQNGTGTVTPTAHWWCNATYGYRVYQIDSPGSGWVACVGPTTENGWYLSVDGFGGPDIIVEGGLPANPRSWLQIATWAAGNAAMLGGSPGESCVLNNRMVYPADTYTQGTHYPPIRVFNGRSDVELCRLPPTTGDAVPKAVISMLAANGLVYLTSWDTGTTSADWRGRVFELDPTSGKLTSLGTQFAAGELPYALAWHMGRLWCGTNNGIGTVGKIYFYRPGIDTGWTLDHATSTDAAGGVDSMVSYGGKLYVGTDNVALSRGKVLVRDAAGAWTISRTGSGGTAIVNNGYLSLQTFGTNLYASYWNNDTTPVSKIEKFDGSSWTLVYTGATTTNRPFIQLVNDSGSLYAVGGGLKLAAALLVSSNGTSWTDLTAELPETDNTLLPTFGAVVL